MINWFSKVILTDLNLFTRADRGKMLTALPARHRTWREGREEERGRRGEEGMW